MIEAAEDVSVAGVGHVCDLVGRQDVGGEAADAGRDGRGSCAPGWHLRPWCRRGCREGGFRCPNGGADGVGSERRCRLEAGDIVGGLAGGFPEAGLGAALEAVSLHSDDAGDEALPVAPGQGMAHQEDLGEALFVA